MKKILIVCSLLLAPVALFFLSSSSNNLSELGAQNVEALTWGDNKPSISPYEDMGLLWYQSSEEQLTCTVNGSLELVPFLNLSDGDFEAGFTYKIVFAGFTCQDKDGAICPPLQQSVNSYTIIDKVKSNTPNK